MALEPRFLRDRGMTVEHLIARRRLGLSWEAIKAEIGYERDSQSLAQLVKRHCRATGTEWPIAKVA